MKNSSSELISLSVWSAHISSSLPSGQSPKNTMVSYYLLNILSRLVDVTANTQENT